MGWEMARLCGFSLPELMWREPLFAKQKIGRALRDVPIIPSASVCFPAPRQENEVGKGAGFRILARQLGGRAVEQLGEEPTQHGKQSHTLAGA